MKFICGKCKREKGHEKSHCIRCGSAKTLKMLACGEAREVAERVLDLLAPACRRIVIAGSIRRRSAYVKDIELVCEPLMVERTQTLFGSADEDLVPATDRLVAQLVDEGKLQRNLANKKDGSRYKTLRSDGMNIDLWCVFPPATWGAALAVRTGPAEFNMIIQTPRNQGGAMPSNFHQSGLALWNLNVPQVSETEEEYFELLGLPCWRPELRTPERLRTYLQTERIRHARVITKTG